MIRGSRFSLFALCALTVGCGKSGASPSAMCSRLIQCIGKVAPSGAAAAVQSYGPSSPCWANDSTSATCDSACQQTYAQAYSDQCGCTQDSDCDQVSCDTTTHACRHPCDPSSAVDLCPNGLACDAKTRLCVQPRACAGDGDCGDGYGCLATCSVNCALSQNGSTTLFDGACATGFKCQADFTCARTSSCTQSDPMSMGASPCGAYVCDYDNFCKITCNSNQDCATGASCDLTSHACL